QRRASRRARTLDEANVVAAEIQGNLSQRRRQEALGGFKDGRYHVLVATDIAARGIDVARVSHVINYDFPDTPEAYTHRIGRTGRAERSGEALTFVTINDLDNVRQLERRLRMRIERRPVDGFAGPASQLEAVDAQREGPGARANGSGGERRGGNRGRSGSGRGPRGQQAGAGQPSGQSPRPANAGASRSAGDRSRGSS